MAMDKNDLTRLVTKVPKVANKYQLDVQDRLDFVNAQILERQKIIYRFLVQVETAKEYADKDDKEANDLAEVKIREATGYIKSQLWELDVLIRLRTELEKEFDNK